MSQDSSPIGRRIKLSYKSSCDTLRVDEALTLVSLKKRIETCFGLDGIPFYICHVKEQEELIVIDTLSRLKDFLAIGNQANLIEIFEKSEADSDPSLRERLNRTVARSRPSSANSARDSLPPKSAEAAPLRYESPFHQAPRHPSLSNSTRQAETKPRTTVSHTANNWLDNDVVTRWDEVPGLKNPIFKKPAEMNTPQRSPGSAEGTGQAPSKPKIKLADIESLKFGGERPGSFKPVPTEQVRGVAASTKTEDSAPAPRGQPVAAAIPAGPEIKQALSLESKSSAKPSGDSWTDPAPPARVDCERAPKPSAKPASDSWSDPTRTTRVACEKASKPSAKPATDSWSDPTPPTRVACEKASKPSAKPASDSWSDPTPPTRVDCEKASKPASDSWSDPSPPIRVVHVEDTNGTASVKNEKYNPVPSARPSGKKDANGIDAPARVTPDKQQQDEAKGLPILRETGPPPSASSVSSLNASDLATIKKASELQRLFREYSFVFSDNSSAEHSVSFLQDQILSNVSVDMDVVRKGLQRLAVSCQPTLPSAPQDNPEIKESPQQCPDSEADIFAEMKQLGTTSDSRWVTEDPKAKGANLKSLVDKSFAAPIKMPLKAMGGAIKGPANKGPLPYSKLGPIEKQMAQKIRLLPTQAIKGRLNAKNCPPNQRFENSRLQPPSTQDINIFGDDPAHNARIEVHHAGSLDYDVL